MAPIMLPCLFRMLLKLNTSMMGLCPAQMWEIKYTMAHTNIGISNLMEQRWCMILSRLYQAVPLVLKKNTVQLRTAEHLVGLRVLASLPILRTVRM